MATKFRKTVIKTFRYALNKFYIPRSPKLESKLWILRCVGIEQVMGYWLYGKYLKKLMLFQNMSIFWCKNVSCTRYQILHCLQKKTIFNYSGFCQCLNDYYMVFINYNAPLKSQRQILLFLTKIELKSWIK